MLMLLMCCQRIAREIPFLIKLWTILGVVYPPCRLQLHAKESFNQHLNVIKGAFFLPPQEGGQQH
jgi:hypothetical protein